MRTHRILLWAVVAALYHGMAMADAPAAGEGAGELQEVVVTAERRSESLQKVPVQVNVYSADQLADLGVRSTFDLDQTTPGLVIVPVSSATQVFMRGIGASNIGGNNESPVAMYVDDVYYSEPAGAVAPLDQAERVEVLKGPQGTLYGRNATAGLINIYTPDPQADRLVKAQIGYASYQAYSGSVYATGGLSDQLKGNISAGVNYQNQGFGRNLSFGTEANFIRDGNARAKLLWEPSSADRVLLEGSYFMTSSDMGLTSALYPGSIPLFGAPAGSIYDTQAETADHRVKAYDGSVRWQHTFDSGMVFKSVTAFRRVEDTSNNTDLDGTAFPFIAVNFSVQDRNWQQEFLLQGKRDRLSYTAGVFFFDDNNKYPIFIPGVISEYTVATTKSYSGFGQADYQLTDHDTLTAGVRYTIDRVGASGQNYVGGALVQSIDKQTTTFREPTWRLALKHELTDELMVYGSYSRGYKSGLYDPGNAFEPPVKPEILNSYEVGFKADYHYLQWGLTGFYYNYSNMQVGFISATGTSVLFENAAKAKIYGAEANVVAALPVPVGNLQVRADFDYLHAKYTKFLGCTVDTPNAPLPGNTQTSGDCSGHDLNYAPRYQLTLSPQYTVPVARLGGELALNVTYHHSDGYYFGADNVFRTGGYNLVGANVAYTFPDESSILRVYGTNLTGARVPGYGELTSFQQDYRPLAPRIIGVRVEHTWK